MVGGICSVDLQLAIELFKVYRHSWRLMLEYTLSTNAISLPVRPPIRPRALPTLFAAPLRAGPADDVTLERPSEAFDLYSVAVSEAFDAVSLAASVALAVVDSERRAVRPVILDVCRSTARLAENDIV